MCCFSANYAALRRKSNKDCLAFGLESGIEETRGLIRTRKWKKEKTAQWIRGKGQKDKQRCKKPLHRKRKIEQHEPHYKPGIKSGTPEG
jgi:hypothetical protein